MQMAIGPAYDCLEDIVETTQTERIWNLDQPPDWRTNLLESDPELVNAKLGFWSLGFRFSCHLHGCHLHHCRSAREANASISRWARPGQGNWLQKKGITSKGCPGVATIEYPFSFDLSFVSAAN